MGKVLVGGPGRRTPRPGPYTQIGALALRPPIHVTRDTPLQTAAMRMRAEGISSLVVDTEPPSFVTERDLVQAIADGLALSEPVSSVATRGPVWVPLSLTVAHAAALMVGLGVRHLLVLAVTDEVVGVLSMRDAFEVLVQAVDDDGWLVAFGARLAEIG